LNDDLKRRRELASFLKNRRYRLSSSDFGITCNPRRRVRGLRREEVADLAGVSNIWYTWLEQGRDVHPSIQVLDSLSKVLRLTRQEIAHLYSLAGIPIATVHPQADDAVGKALQRLLDGFHPYPAYVRGPRWDTLAWNQAACELYGDFNQKKGLERNSLWRMFTRADYLDIFPDWPQLAQNMLGQFRVSYGKHIGDPAFEMLVQTLLQESERFSEWWQHHDVLGTPVGRKRFNHPTLGNLVFEHQSFSVADEPDLRITVYMPVDAAAEG
jgi:transcriptional regulator with XRE-family HTH domain